MTKSLEMQLFLFSLPCFFTFDYKNWL